MRSLRSGAARGLGGAAATLALLAGVGIGLFHLEAALAGPGARRGAALAAGVDPTPVGSVAPTAGRRP